MHRIIHYYKLLLKPLGIALAAAGFTGCFYAFSPGLLSPDSLDQYAQAKNNTYTDWHPPIMSGLWHLLLIFKDGPEPMLIFQLLLYWSSFLALFFFFSRYYAFFCLLIPVLFFSPVFLNFAGNIWKDVHLAFSWLLASVILLRVFYDGRRLSVAEASISLLLVAYGTWVRPNALPGVLPLCYLWICALKDPPRSLKASLVVGAKSLLLASFIFGGQIVLTRFVLKAQKNHIEYKLFLHDLQGISRETGRTCFPQFVQEHPGFDMEYLNSNYRYTTFDHIWWNAEGRDLVPKGVDEARVAETRDFWIRQILKEPSAYLKNKVIGYLYFLRIYRSGTRLEIFYPHIHPNDHGFTFSPNKVFMLLQKKVEKNADSILFEPWFWALLNLILPVIAIMLFRRRNVLLPVMALTLSSLFYLLFEFLVFPADTEFRYFYWNVLALSISALLLTADQIHNLQKGRNIGADMGINQGVH